MNVPSEYAVIEQSKNPPKYTQSTFSNYQKTQVSKALIKAIEKMSLEEVCHWAIELHCSGQIESLILNLSYLVSERINIANPFLPEWWWNRMKKYIRIKTLFGKSAMLINSRNNQEMRNLLAEMSVVLTMSEKNNSFVTSKLPKINAKHFKSFNYQNKILKKNTAHIIRFYLEGDYRAGLNVHENLVVAFQQYVNHLYSGNYDGCAWWVMWIFAYDKTSKYQDLEAPIKSQKNAVLSDLNDKLDWVWIFWDFLLRYIQQFHSNHHHGKTHIKEQVEALYYMYLYGLTKANKSKKVVHLLNAVSYIKKNMDWTIPLILPKKEAYLVQISANINVLYKRVNSNRDSYMGEQISKNMYQNQLDAQYGHGHGHSSGHSNNHNTHSHTPVKKGRKKMDEYETESTGSVDGSGNVKIKVSKKKLEEEERERKQNHLDQQFDLIDQLLKTRDNGTRNNNRNELQEMDMQSINNPYHPGYGNSHGHNTYISDMGVPENKSTIIKMKQMESRPQFKSINIRTSGINNDSREDRDKDTDRDTLRKMRHDEFMKQRQQELDNDEDYIANQVQQYKKQKPGLEPEPEYNLMEEINEDMEMNDVNSDPEFVSDYNNPMYLNDRNDYPQNITDDEDYSWE